MSPYANTYSAFMLDHASGALPPAERIVADLHVALSASGRRMGLIAAAMGGALLEAGEAAPMPFGPADPGEPDKGAAASRMAQFLDGDLLALKWRRSIFGVKTASAGMPMAELLRLDPGETAPGHCHGRRDVTVVLTGSYADEYGVYTRGDLAFAEPGMRHQPRAVGDKTCICLIATEAGRPVQGLLGLFGIGVRKYREHAS